MDEDAGYLEIEHTADWEIFVWAPDLTTLLETAAQGMSDLSQIKLATSPREVRNFEVPYADRESLLVDFLSELLFFAEDDGGAFDRYQFEIDENRLEVQATGAPIKDQTKEIKAVTFHRMQILDTERGLEVYIVFDV